MANGPHEYRVALESLVLCVNADNPVGELDLDQIRRIFTLKVKNWKAVGGRDASITLYGRDRKSGVSEFFREAVLNGESVPWSLQAASGSAAVADAVGRDKNGIGFGGRWTARRARR